MRTSKRFFSKKAATCSPRVRSTSWCVGASGFEWKRSGIRAAISAPSCPRAPKIAMTGDFMGRRDSRRGKDALAFEFAIFGDGFGDAFVEADAGLPSES